MQSIVLDRQILPEPIISYFHTEKIRLSEKNGTVVLSPLNNKPNVNELFGMFSDGRLSSEDFIKEKALERDISNIGP